MRKKLSRIMRYVPAAALCSVAGLLAFDLFAFWALELRPLVSVDGVESAAWAILWGSAIAAGLRWAILRESRLRLQVAVALAVMVAFSAMHPWHNGYGVPAELPVRAEGQRSLPADDVLVFEGGPLSGPADSRW